MRLSVRISPVEPSAYELPEQCPYPDCESKLFTLRQDHCAKALRDPTCEDVEVQRQRGLRCGRRPPTFPTFLIDLGRAPECRA